jgi:peptidoglycan/xylan/chitin deacetylase (PgdA/CDA1 family)
MRNVSDAIVRTLGTVPFAAGLLQRLAGCGFVVFYAHVVSDERLPHIRPLYTYRNRRQFEADLDALAAARRPVALDDLAAALEGGRLPPGDTFLLTFDDGLREAGEVIAPILKRRGWPAAFFVNSAFVDNASMFFRHKAALILDALRTRGESARRRVGEVLAAHGIPAAEDPERGIRSLGHGQSRVLDDAAAAIDLDVAGFLAARRPYLTREELRTLAADGFAIGAHSRSHPLYAAIPEAAQRDETLSSLDFVRRNFAPKTLSFAFPFDDSGVSARLFDDMAAAGVKVSFGTAGLRRDDIATHIQRIPAEKAHRGIRDDLTAACLKAMRDRAVGRGRIAR